MLFPDYSQTGVVYHVASITDLNNILENGIKYDDKASYITKYKNFHKYIDSLKTKEIPSWVIRQKAIFASLNFDDKHCWHSHTVIMAVKIQPEKCWIANENLANSIYEPFILKDVKGFNCANNYLETKGREIAQKYWETSLSFIDNLRERRDKKKGYDAEVMIFHDIPPDDIKLIYIVSDHKMMTIQEWKKFFNCGS